MEKRKDPLSDLSVHSGNRFQILQRGFPDPLHALEVSKEPLLPLPPNTGDLIQKGVKISLLFQFLMVRDGESVGLVPDSLK